MTRGSIREYTEAVRERYLHGSKREKGKILDEFTKSTGRHRKAAIRLLRRRNQPRMSPHWLLCWNSENGRGLLQKQSCGRLRRYPVSTVGGLLAVTVVAEK